MGKWQRYQYLPLQPLGDDGRMVTGGREHIALSRKAATEGMVLLKNENKALPLVPGEKVALFGKACADYVKGGGGSGDVTVSYVRSFCAAMEEKASQGKLSVFEPLHNFYTENIAKQRAEGKLPGLTDEPELPADLLEQAAETCDTAVISINRFSGEGWDRKAVAGDFYLSENEQTMVDAVCDKFSKVIVVLNVGGMVDSSWFKDNAKIQAVLLAWQGGMEGASAQADILCGEANPSGKLVDTFAASFDDYPSSYNFNESEDYVCYTDDVFVGYRYFETIPGAAEKVNYPFGFGLSYTTFAVEVLACDGVNTTVRVTNTGDTAGREVVQLYMSAPECRLEMPRVELRAFQKTKRLAPGESQEIILTVKPEQLASYDEKLAAWVLFQGEYKIFVGNSVRNLALAGSYINAAERITEQAENRCAAVKLPKRMKADGTYEELEMGEYPERIDPVDWPINPRWGAEYVIPNEHGIDTPADKLKLTAVVDGKITMEQFIESLSDDELITLCGGCANRGVADTRGIGGLEAAQVPAVMTADGPAGLRICPDRGVNTTAWPVATMLASTWDPEIVYQVGEAAGKEVRENNIGMWLTPAMNIHRSPLCGRNFEYYAEDPLVAGKLAAAMVQGIQSQRVSACAKHFCVNNKETNRTGSDSRVSERALREIYLKGFEIVVKEGGTWSIMTAYNLLNGDYTSEKYDLLTGILRKEWGYTGIVVTDWDDKAEHYRGILGGNNVRMPHGSPKRLQMALKEGLLTRQDLINNVVPVLNWLMKLD